MTYSTTRAELVSIVGWLKSTDDVSWLDQIDLLADTIFSLKELVPDMIHQTVVPPEGAAICFAMPRLVDMMAAMFGGERAKAVQFGETVLDILPESASTDSLNSSILSHSTGEAISCP